MISICSTQRQVAMDSWIMKATMILVKATRMIRIRDFREPGEPKVFWVLTLGGDFGKPNSLAVSGR